MRHELEEIKRDQSSVSISIDPPIRNQTQAMQLLYKEYAKKDRELQELREKVDSLFGSKITSSTLPTTVTIDNTLCSIKSFSNESQSNRDNTQMHESLLDLEIAGLEDMEHSRISNNDDSFGHIFDNDQLSSLHLSSDSANMNCPQIHQAVAHGNKATLVNLIEDSSNIDQDINSTDSIGRYVNAFSFITEFIMFFTSHLCT